MEKSQRGRDLLDWVAVTVVWAFAIALAQPYGNFPLNDDWDFALATWRFAETGHFHFTPFTAVSLRAQVLWGAAWTRLFGESFNVLRASTLTLAMLTIAVVFFSLRRAGAPRWLRVAATLAFAFHPVFFWASCTYMTEVPFVFASAVTMFLFFRALDEDRLDLLFAGCAAAAVSWFVRQTGVTNLFAPLALILVLRSRLTPRWKGFAAVIGGFLVAFALLLFFKREWLSGSPAEFANHFKVWTEVTFRTPQQIALVSEYTALNAQNAALFFLPLTAGTLFMIRRKTLAQYALIAFFAVVVVTTVRWQISRGQTLPYGNTPEVCCNTLVDWGLGQQTLSDIWRWKLPFPHHLSPAARMILTWGSAILAILLLAQVISSLFRDERLFVRLSAATAMAGTAALFGSGLYTDRYSLDSAWSAGLFVAMVIPWDRKSVRFVAIVCLVAVASFDVMAVQEYFAWNRARWSAFDALRSQGIPVEQIDGGSEPFSFYEISKMDQRQRRREVVGFRQRPFVLTFQPAPGYAIVARHPYHGWLAAHDGAIFTLRKE